MRFLTPIFLLALLTLTNPARAQELLTTIDHGTLRAICAPWGGPAFSIVLDSKIYVSVYSSIDALEKSGGAARFHAGENPAPRKGKATISMCDSRGAACTNKEGMVSVTLITKDMVTGTIQLYPTGWGGDTARTENHTFKAKYDRNAKSPCR